MDDPVYESGLTAKSVVCMVSDISNALAGRVSYISTPVPLEGRSPTSYISFSGSVDTPASLNLPEGKAQSRRVYNYSLRNDVVGHKPRPHSISNDSIVLSMNDVMNNFGEIMKDDDYVEEECDGQTSNIETCETTKEEPAPIPVRSRRRRVVHQN